MNQVENLEYKGREIVFTSWTSKYDGCLLTDYTIDGVGYPFPHRSKEAAVAKAKQIIGRACR
jgi:hypothetical protein